MFTSLFSNLIRRTSTAFRLTLVAAVLATTALFSAEGGPIHSGLVIDPGKQFVLGGGQRGAFRVKGINSGAVAVRVVERFVTGDTLGRGTLVPGQRADLPFRAGSAALIVNLSQQKPANLDLKVTGAGTSQNLGMTYEAAHTR